MNKSAKDSNRFIAIMAGGVGSRFWPASRESCPKQFLDILGTGKTLLQETYDRAKLLVQEKNILIVSNHMYKNLIIKQLPEINENQILLEPSRNNTGPCVAYTALHIKAISKDAVFAVLPSDHMIKNLELYVNLMHAAFECAKEQDSIVTLGIQPNRADTGYGYINYGGSPDEHGAFHVKSFKEKPDAETARTYVDSGEFLWNSGMFIWSVKTLLKQFSISAPDIITILSQNEEAFGTREEQDFIDKVYPLTANISVDYAILEHAKNVKTIPADIAWSDLGTWNSLYDYLLQKDEQNVILGKAQIEGKGNLIRAPKDKLIVTSGLDDFIIVDEGDVLLIYPREKEQDIKAIRNGLEKSPYV